MNKVSRASSDKSHSNDMISGSIKQGNGTSPEYACTNGTSHAWCRHRAQARVRTHAAEQAKEEAYRFNHS